MRRIETPIDKNVLKSLRAGDKVLLSGVVYTARDAAHKRLVEALSSGEGLPMDLRNQTIYYVGPAPTKDGAVIGPAGPTTSGRMDMFTPRLLDYGLSAMIGKGKRDQNVIDAMKVNEAVYFAAIGGAAALIAESVKSIEIVAYEDLGTEAIRRLVIEDMPLTVAIDSQGQDYYVVGRQKYLTEMREAIS